MQLISSERLSGNKDSTPNGCTSLKIQCSVVTWLQSHLASITKGLPNQRMPVQYSVLSHSVASPPDRIHHKWCHIFWFIMFLASKMICPFWKVTLVNCTVGIWESGQCCKLYFNVVLLHPCVRKSNVLKDNYVQHCGHAQRRLGCLSSVRLLRH